MTATPPFFSRLCSRWKACMLVVTGNCQSSGLLSERGWEGKHPPSQGQGTFFGFFDDFLQPLSPSLRILILRDASSNAACVGLRLIRGVKRLREKQNKGCCTGSIALQQLVKQSVVLNLVMTLDSVQVSQTGHLKGTWGSSHCGSAGYELNYYPWGCGFDPWPCSVG